MLHNGSKIVLSQSTMSGPSMILIFRYFLFEVYRFNVSEGMAQREAQRMIYTKRSSRKKNVT